MQQRTRLTIQTKVNMAQIIQNKRKLNSTCAPVLFHQTKLAESTWSKSMAPAHLQSTMTISTTIKNFGVFISKMKTWSLTSTTLLNKTTNFHARSSTLRTSMKTLWYHRSWPSLTNSCTDCANNSTNRSWYKRQRRDKLEFSKGKSKRRPTEE